MKKTPIKTANDFLKDLPAVRSAGDLKGMLLRRSVPFTREAVDIEKRTVNLSFATEAPVKRWYGFEILDCRPKAVRLERLNSRAPILVDHDPCDQVGVIDGVRMDKDRTGRVESRYSRSARGEEIFQDILDEIRTNTSVGYMVHDAILEKEEDGVPTYRITDWEPYEVSIVSMPADINCGVGRSADTKPEPPQTIPPKKETRAMKKCKYCGCDHDRDHCGCHGERQALETEARAVEQKRTTDLLTLGDKFAARGGRELANELLKDATATTETFNARMLAKIDAEQAPPTRREGHIEAPRVEVGLRYDKRSLEPFMRGARNLVQDAERAAYAAGMWGRAIVFGDPAAERWCKDNNLDLRVMTSATGAAGGFLVPDALESAIIDLRVEYGMARSLAEIWPMSSGTLSVPVRKTGTTAYFVGQQDATSESDASWGEANLVAKEVSALTRISNSLAEDAIIDLAAKLADEHAYAFAGKEDACLIDGDGTAAYGGITGLKALLETSGMAGIYTAATNTDTPAEVIAGELSGVMAKLPSYARKGAVWCASPAFDELIFGRLMAAAGGNTTTTLAGAIVAAYLGKPRVVCEPCYSNPAADLTGKAMAFYGNFKQGIAFGERRGITVQILRERYAEYRQTGIIGTERIDINCHGVGDLTVAGPIVALIGG